MEDENTQADNFVRLSDGDATADQLTAEESYTPIYKVFTDSKIPVSKHTGKMWEQRLSEIKSQNKVTGAERRWTVAIDYYQDDQTDGSVSGYDLAEISTGDNKKKQSTENIIYANVSSLVPALYAKNPDISISTDENDKEDQVNLFEKLLDRLFSGRMAPAVNIKPKMKKLTVITLLTNIAYLEVSYTKREESSEQVLAEIEKLSTELQEAKDITVIREIEGKLQALDEKVSLFQPSGPKVRVRKPDMVFVDPASEEADMSDAGYVITSDYIRTDFIRAVYGEKDDKGEWKSIYNPTHVLKVTNKEGTEEEDNTSFHLISESEYSRYGYKTEEQFRNNSRTLVRYVWDKTTRRVYMFNDLDWSYPIWVWDDPYKLSRFFPVIPLTYTTDPTDRYGRSEIVYYIQQQDEINKINNERARMRHWITSKIFFDKDAFKNTNVVEKFLSSNTEDRMIGIDIPEGKRLSDMIATFPLPSTQFEQLFKIDDQLAAINRLSSVTPTMQNAQYKTNTTNRAIESYESTTQERLDEKIDATEDVMAEVGQSLLEMCVQFMTEEEVIVLIGKAGIGKAKWTNMTTEELNETFTLNIQGGSTIKPTSKAKKDQAMFLSQVLGQFANASPMLVLVMLKMVERAFRDDVTITPDEWNMVIQSTQQQMQRGSSQGQPPQEGAPTQQPTNSKQPPQQGQSDQGSDIAQIVGQIDQVLEQLPPEVKQVIVEAIKRGIPLTEVVKQLTSGNAQ